jgi:SpoVK/Ycf46/Vps4 family AAA+-type ATPase
MFFQLTPSQKKAEKELETFFEKNRVSLLCGPSKCGKKTVAKKFLQDKIYEEINIIDEMGSISSGIELTTKLDECVTKITDSKVDYLLINNWEHLLLWTSSSKFKIYSYAHDVVIQFTKKLEQKRFKTIITMEKSSAQSMISTDTWLTHVDINKEDVEFLLKQYHDNESEIKNVSSTIKIQNVEEIVTWASQSKKVFPEIENWTERFKKIQSISSPYALDSNKEVSIPELNIHMLGIEEIIKQIELEVVNPIKLSDPAVPICKGMLLYGAPGSGKTSIGRWLSFLLEGKVYLCEKSNEDLITVFNRMMRRAIKKAPSIVFIDDIDSILEHPSLVRDLLVTLDGMQTKGRENVTVIMTCMDISLVPSALIRGGRLERCIEFKYPNSDVIKLIIENRFKKSIDDLRANYPKVVEYLEKKITPKVIKKMVYSVSGWSPSNIHLLVDIVIRNSVCGNCDPLEIFAKEVKQMEELREKTCQNPSEKNQSNSTGLYV